MRLHDLPGPEARQRDGEALHVDRAGHHAVADVVGDWQCLVLPVSQRQPVCCLQTCGEQSNVWLALLCGVAAGKQEDWRMGLSCDTPA